MHPLRPSDLPFPIQTGVAGQDGLYAEERPDGTLGSVAFWRAGRRLAELVVDDNQASWRTIEHFQPVDSEDPADPDGSRRWLEGIPLQRLRDLAEGTQRCAFCEKTSAEVKKLVMGPRVGICNECIALCAEIINT
jgi:hypothetical protein